MSFHPSIHMSIQMFMHMPVHMPMHMYMHVFWADKQPVRLNKRAGPVPHGEASHPSIVSALAELVSALQKGFIEQPAPLRTALATARRAPQFETMLAQLVHMLDRSAAEDGPHWEMLRLLLEQDNCCASSSTVVGDGSGTSNEIDEEDTPSTQRQLIILVLTATTRKLGAVHAYTCMPVHAQVQMRTCACTCAYKHV